MNNHRPQVVVTGVGGGGGGASEDAVVGEGRVVENAPLGTVVAHIRVSDADSGPSGQVWVLVFYPTASLFIFMYND